MVKKYQVNIMTTETGYLHQAPDIHLTFYLCLSNVLHKCHSRCGSYQRWDEMYMEIYDINTMSICIISI